MVQEAVCHPGVTAPKNVGLEEQGFAVALPSTTPKVVYHEIFAFFALKVSFGVSVIPTKALKSAGE